MRQDKRIYLDFGLLISSACHVKSRELLCESLVIELSTIVGLIELFDCNRGWVFLFQNDSRGSPFPLWAFSRLFELHSHQLAPQSDALRIHSLNVLLWVLFILFKVIFFYFLSCYLFGVMCCGCDTYYQKGEKHYLSNSLSCIDCVDFNYSTFKIEFNLF